MTHILRGMLARSDFRCCCSRAEVSGRGQDFRNPMPTRTPVVNHSMRQTCRVTDFAAFGARLRSRTAPCTFRIQYRASQTSHRSSPQSTVSKRKRVKRHERKENPYGAALWKLLRSGAPLCAAPLVPRISQMGCFAHGCRMDVIWNHSSVSQSRASRSQPRRMIFETSEFSHSPRASTMAGWRLFSM